MGGRGTKELLYKVSGEEETKNRTHLIYTQEMEPDQLRQHLEAFMNTELKRAASIRDGKISEIEKVLLGDVSKCEEERDKMVSAAERGYRNKMNKGIEAVITLAKKLGADHIEPSSEGKHGTDMDNESARYNEATVELRRIIQNINVQFRMWIYSVNERAENDTEAAREEYERINKNISNEMMKFG
jgi:hypothetical protein